MLGNLRTGAPLFVLDKSKQTVSIAEVISVTPQPAQFGMAYTPNGMMPQRPTVNIRARIDGAEINFNRLIADAVSAEDQTGGVVICESKDAMVSEITAFRANSARALEQVPMHQQIVSNCDKLLLQFDPTRQREVEQSKEIAGLRNEISELKALLSQTLNVNKQPKKKED